MWEAAMRYHEQPHFLKWDLHPPPAWPWQPSRPFFHESLRPPWHHSPEPTFHG